MKNINMFRAMNILCALGVDAIQIQVFNVVHIAWSRYKR